MLFSLLVYTRLIIYGLVKKVCDVLVYLLITFLLDLELNFIGKLLVFPWELIVLLLLQICFVFVMKEISHGKIRLTLLRLSFPIHLNDLLDIDNIYFDQIVDRIYPTELQLNKANSSDTEAPFLDLNLWYSFHQNI